MSYQISRRDFLSKCALGGLSLGATSFFTSCVSARSENLVRTVSQKPNIVFIYADDWGWGDLGCHGNTWLSTPNLDRLASEGTEFYQFNVNNPVCSPSRTAVITGHFPARYCIHEHFGPTAQDNQKRNMPDWLDPKAQMLPRLFKQAGYVTGHFGKWHLTNARVTDAPLPTEYGYDESAVFNGPGVQVKVNDACDRAVDFIKRHRQKPFFINLWVHETHTPHYPSEESMKRFSYLDEQRQVYTAVVADGDKRIGKVLDVLRQLGLDNNTLVIFSSDNGPEVTGSPNNKKRRKGFQTYYSVGTTGGLRGRKRSLLEGGIRTPFFVRWPGVVPAGKINKTTEITAVDMLPTLCAAAAIPLPMDYKPDGENMLDAFKGNQTNRTKPIFFEWLGTHSGDNWPCLGARFGKWKLLMSSDQSRIELYDIPRDREESENLAQQNPEVVKDLVAMISEWKSQLPKSPSPDCMSTLRKEKL